MYKDLRPENELLTEKNYHKNNNEIMSNYRKMATDVITATDIIDRNTVNDLGFYSSVENQFNNMKTVKGEITAIGIIDSITVNDFDFLVEKQCNYMKTETGEIFAFEPSADLEQSSVNSIMYRTLKQGNVLLTTKTTRCREKILSERDVVGMRRFQCRGLCREQNCEFMNSDPIRFEPV